jgi:hypothetical protein
MGTRKRAELIELAKARALKPDKPRLVDRAPVCAWAGCRRPLTKARPHQKYCTDACRYRGWLEAGGRHRAPVANLRKP